MAAPYKFNDIIRNIDTNKYYVVTYIDEDKVFGLPICNFVETIPMVKELIGEFKLYSRGGITQCAANIQTITLS